MRPGLSLGFIRRGLVIGAVVALTAPLFAGTAAARPLERERFHDTFSEELEDFCDVAGLNVSWGYDDYVNVLFNARGRDGLAYLTATIHGEAWWTNLATGKTMTQVYDFVDKDQKVTDNGDGTLTILVLNTGKGFVLDANGRLLFNDPGQIRFEVLIDHGGTPDDPSDDEFLEFLGVVKGSTGRNDLEGRDFCEDFLAITS